MPDSRPIYLDYNATTPVDPAVLDAMLPWLASEFGNPSSQHAYGKAAHEAVARARAEVAGQLRRDGAVELVPRPLATRARGGEYPRELFTQGVVGDRFVHA